MYDRLLLTMGGRGMTASKTYDARRVRLLAWGGAAALILLPLLALKAVDPTAWQNSDLPFAFIMVAAVGMAFELAVRTPLNWSRRAGACAAVATALMLVWGNLAVGFAGSEDDRINIIFFAIPLVALIGSVIARFRSEGMVLALVGAAATQIAVGIMALFDGHFTMPLSVSFAGFWLASALLFRRSVRQVGSLTD
jgi:hypothetical protein